MGLLGVAIVAKYGRGDGEWEELATAGRAILEEFARREGMTNYTDFNEEVARRTGHRCFDFNREDERAAMGWLLGLIVDDTFPEIGAMLSALVTYLNENHPGRGFYNLAREKGLLPRGSSAQQEMDFWVQQTQAVYAHYRMPRLGGASGAGAS